MILLDTDHLSLLQARDAPVALLGTNGQARWGGGTAARFRCRTSRVIAKE